MRVHIDFESRSHCDIQACGPSRYAEDPSTEILCVAFAVDDGKPHLISEFSERIRTSEWFKTQDLNSLAKDPEVIFVAYNAGFESSMWAEQMVKKHGFAPIPIERWQCTASQAYALSLPRKLEDVAKVLKLDEEKDKDGSALMRRMCIIPDPPMPAIDPVDLIRLGEYCIQDVIVEREIERRLPPLSPHEQAIYTVDQRINKRGIALDVELVTKGAACVSEVKAIANEEITEATAGEVTTVGQTKRIKKYANDHGVMIEDTQADTIDAELVKPDLSPLVRRVFEIRRSTGRAAVAKYAAMETAVCSDGRVRDHLVYCGAGRTRRWSGKRVQTQNIARGYKDDHDIAAACEVLRYGDSELASILFYGLMPMLSGLIRSMLIARDGSRFITVDFSGIEARVFAVVSNNVRMLRDFEQKRDPYITQAAAIYNVEYEDIAPEGDPRRFFGKQAILGLGYGMGAPKFQATCAKYGQLIELDFAEKVVFIYRDNNVAVTDFWKQIEIDVKSVITKQKPIKRQYYGFRWDYQLDALVMILPDGSKRWYLDARIELREKWGKTLPTITYMGVHSKTGKWARLETYGGKLTENLIQSIGRQLQADSLLAIDRIGWPVVLHAHDEIVCELPHGSGSIDELIRLMTTASPWASAWPIGASGWEGSRYKK